MKNLTIVFLISFFITTYVNSQFDMDFHSFDKQEIFSEKFLDNHNNWRRFYNKIKKGKYVVETIGKDQPAITTIPIQIDPDRNYEIEIEISIEWNRSNEFMGIVWNRDLNKGYYLAFNKDLETMVFLKEYNTEKVLKEPEKLGVLYPIYSKNSITIRKVDAEYLIYINQMLTYKIPFEQNYGDHIGFFVGSASELRVYSLTVSYLNSDTADDKDILVLFENTH